MQRHAGCLVGRTQRYTGLSSSGRFPHLEGASVSSLREPAVGRAGPVTHKLPWKLPVLTDQNSQLSPQVSACELTHLVNAPCSPESTYRDLSSWPCKFSY